MSEKTNQSPLLKVVVILLVIAIAVGGFIAYQIISKKNQRLKEEETGLFKNIEQDPNVILAEGGKSISEQLEELQKKVDEGTVSLNMDITMLVKENSTTGEVYIENSTKNRYDMFVTVFLDETQSQIAQTGIIPRGNAIESIELDEKLEKGTHQATITYNLIDEDKQVVEQASVGIEIVVR